MSGVRAFNYAFNERYLIPVDRFENETYEARTFGYALAESFYHNSVYRSIETFSATLKHQYSLYKHIRGVYNPVYRQNEIIKSKIAGGAIDWENLDTGPYQVVADDALKPLITQVWRWSNFGTLKGVYVHMAALLGDCGLWVTDDVERGKVRIEVMHPARIQDADFDESGNVKSAVIEYEREWLNPDTGKREDVTYRMEADKGSFRTLKNGEPFAWHNDMAEWDNPYGFVPLVVAKYKSVGRKWGVNAFHASMEKIHETNSLASILADSIALNINPPMLLAGVPKPTSTPKVPGSLSDGTTSSDPTAQRDRKSFLYGPADAKAIPLVIPQDITGVAQVVEANLAELERDMPENALHRLRDSGQMSGVAIRNSYSDATGRLDEGAGNTDDAWVRATQMAVSMAAYRRLPEFRGFDLNSYARGDLDMYIKERQFFEDKLTPQEEIGVISTLPDNREAARYILVNKLQLTEDEANAIVANIQPQQQAGQGMNPAFFDEVGAMFDEIDNAPQPDMAAPLDEQQVDNVAA